MGSFKIEIFRMKHLSVFVFSIFTFFINKNTAFECTKENNPSEYIICEDLVDYCEKKIRGCEDRNGCLEEVPYFYNLYHSIQISEVRNCNCADFICDRDFTREEVKNEECEVCEDLVDSCEKKIQTCEGRNSC